MTPRAIALTFCLDTNLVPAQLLSYFRLLVEEPRELEANCDAEVLTVLTQGQLFVVLIDFEPEFCDSPDPVAIDSFALTVVRLGTDYIETAVCNHWFVSLPTLLTSFLQLRARSR